MELDIPFNQDVEWVAPTQVQFGMLIVYCDRRLDRRAKTVGGWYIPWRQAAYVVEFEQTMKPFLAQSDCSILEETANWYGVKTSGQFAAYSGDTIPSIPEVAPPGAEIEWLYVPETARIAIMSTSHPFWGDYLKWMCS